MASRERTRPPLVAVVRSSLRALATTAGLVTVYYLLPLDTSVLWATALALVLGLVLLTGLVVMHVRSIMVSAYPVLRAVEALAVSVPLFVLLFAGSYVVLAGHEPHSFSQPLTHTDALYFAVTVLATVGFGDIVPVSETARVVVMCQMIADLIIIGVAIRAVLAAVRRARGEH